MAAYQQKERRNDVATLLRATGYSFSCAWITAALDGIYGQTKHGRGPRGPYARRNDNTDKASEPQDDILRYTGEVQEPPQVSSTGIEGVDAGNRVDRPTVEDFENAVRESPIIYSPNCAGIYGDEPEPTDIDDIYTEEVVPGVIESADRFRETTEARTLVFTSAQSNTRVHEAFLQSLLNFCEHRGAELHVSQYTYNKGSSSKKSVKPGADTQEGEKVWFDPAIAPYVSDTSLQLAPDLVWCGELNVIPTMKFPLTQFQTYTRQASAIIPHAKMAMDSVPTMKGTPTKMLYTTGTVTQRNYIERTAGRVADFHHVFGAILVEIDDHGNWWVRQINATNDGTFYDLTEYFTPAGVTENHRVQAITHGDIHWEKRDASVLSTVFSPGGVVDKLVPREQFFHDTVDFAARNHHNIKDPHFLHEMLANGTDSVEAEFVGAGDFLSNFAYRGWSHTVIVTSNHDQAIELWLRNPVAMADPVNVKLWHHLNLYCHEMISRRKKPRPFGYALTSHMHGMVLDNFTLVHEDDSYMILDSIEAGLHGHLGPNGARGSPKNLRTVGKANTGHTHTAGIVDGVYTSGLYSNFEMGYNKGLSSWSHSMVVTYPNAKRAILTIKNGRAWR